MFGFQNKLIFAGAIAGAAFAMAPASAVPDVSTYFDTSAYMPRAEADATVAAINAKIDGIAPYARVKWAGQNLSTNNSGVATIAVPPGRMASGISVSGIVVHTAGQYAVPLVQAVGSPSAGYTVTVTFAKSKTQVTVPAVVVGSAAVNLPLFEAQASTGAVSFDIGFSEPDVIGS